MPFVFSSNSTLSAFAVQMSMQMGQTMEMAAAPSSMATQPPSSHGAASHGGASQDDMAREPDGKRKRRPNVKYDSAEYSKG